MRKVQAWCVAPAFILLMCIALPARAAVEGRFERTLTVSGAVSLSVTSGSGGIDVSTGPDGAVHVAGVIRANTWNATVSSDEVARAVKELEARPPIVQQGNSGADRRGRAAAVRPRGHVRAAGRRPQPQAGSSPAGAAGP